MPPMTQVSRCEYHLVSTLSLGNYQKLTTRFAGAVGNPVSLSNQISAHRAENAGSHAAEDRETIADQPTGRKRQPLGPPQA